MIRVLCVVADNNIGGIQNRIMMIGESLAKNDIQCIILSPNGKGKFSQIARRKGFTVHQAHIHSPKAFSSLRGLIKNVIWMVTIPLSIVTIIKIVYQEKIDIIHVNGLLSIHASIAAIITNKPLIWHLISTLYPLSLVILIRPVVKEFTHTTIFIAQKMIRYYLGDEFDRNKIKVIYEPVDTEQFKRDNIKKSQKMIIRQKLNIQRDFKIVGFVGNINPVKGIEYIIRSANEIKKETSIDIKFLLIGNKSDGHDKYMQKLQQMIIKHNLEENVIFCGGVSHEMIPEYLSIMNIFLITSLAEGTPLVILEAMSMSIPVIATDVGGISEQIENGKTGIIVPRGDTKAISEAIVYLFEHPTEMDQMGKNGRKRAEELFSLDKCVSEHIELYRNCVKNRCIK